MRKALYATFETPLEANEAVADLLQRGVSEIDIAVITKRTYKDPAFDPDEPRFELPRPIWFEENSTAEVTAEEFLGPRDPFGDNTDEVWLLDKMRFPGDLTTLLKELGFTGDIAYDMENYILEGAAILILRVPSGEIDEAQGSQVVLRHRGHAIAPQMRNPYLG